MNQADRKKELKKLLKDESFSFVWQFMPQEHTEYPGDKTSQFPCAGCISEAVSIVEYFRDKYSIRPDSKHDER